MPADRFQQVARELRAYKTETDDMIARQAERIDELEARIAAYDDPTFRSPSKKTSTQGAADTSDGSKAK